MPDESKARQVYLETVPWEEALRKWFAALDAAQIAGTGGEIVPVSAALGRVTSAAVQARRSVPHFNAAAMDGIATKAALTFGASETSPVRLRIGMAQGGPDAVEVDTGDPLPSGCDCVIMDEDVHYVDGRAVAEIIEPAVPWQHVRQIGEDIVATEMLFAAGRTLRPEDLGALLASGHTTVEVKKRPVVAIVPTGDEIVDASRDLATGEIPEFNSTVLSGLIAQWGGKAVVLPVTPDDLGEISRSLERACSEADVAVLIAGSSAGRGDFSAAAIRAAGSVVVHGVAIKPGKPVMMGLAHGKPAIGLPGYPVSCYLTACMFLKPLVYRLQGLPSPAMGRVTAALTKRAVSQPGVDEYVRVKVGKVGGRMVVTPIARGAGMITSLVRADGIILIPRFSEGLEEGSEVEVDLLRPLDDIVNSVVIIGSHDVALDVLGGMLSSRFPGYSVSSAHTGSMGGLIALKRGEAHAAGTHLLDEATGEYNVPYIRKVMPGRDVRLVTLAHRLQGFMVAPGNPMGIVDFTSLVKQGVRFVNRQRGAGTRLLLDCNLKAQGIDPDRIDGYRREEFTHMGVAAAVAGGSADAGLGILAAARALGLDFVPVGEERYELAIPSEHYETPAVRRMLEVINSGEFKRAVEALGGYDTRETGLERPA